MKKDVERARRQLAGLPVQGKAGRPRGSRPKLGDLRRLYVKQGLSLRETARNLGFTKDVIARALKEAGIKRRPHVNPPKLCGKRTLAAVLNARYQVRWHGYQKRAWPEIAREYNVSARTLRRFVLGAATKDASPPKGLNDMAGLAWLWQTKCGRGI